MSASGLLCPECAQGKTRNCTGEAYADEIDVLVICDTKLAQS